MTRIPLQKIAEFGKSIERGGTVGEILYGIHAASQDIKHGEDFVNLGYLAGLETAMSAFARDIRGIIKHDARGNSLDALSIMKNINSRKECSSVVTSVA
jgi:hypothetical protein